MIMPCNNSTPIHNILLDLRNNTIGDKVDSPISYTDFDNNRYDYLYTFSIYFTGIYTYQTHYYKASNAFWIMFDLPTVNGKKYTGLKFTNDNKIEILGSAE